MPANSRWDLIQRLKGSFYLHSKKKFSTSVATRSMVSVCVRSLVGFACSKYTGSWRSVLGGRCVLSNRGLCVGLITRSEESIDCGVSECNREASITRRL